MKEIKLTQGKFAIVDDDDFYITNQYKWFLHKEHGHFYAKKSAIVNGKKCYLEGMHRFILGLSFKDGVCVDHIDGNGLNNQRSNLRTCSHAENQRNSKTRTDNKSGFKGVYWEKSASKWRSLISFNGKQKNLGLFVSAQEAFDAYKKASLEYHKEFSPFYKKQEAA